MKNFLQKKYHNKIQDLLKKQIENLNSIRDLVLIEERLKIKTDALKSNHKNLYNLIKGQSNYSEVLYKKQHEVLNQIEFLSIDCRGRYENKKYINMLQKKINVLDVLYLEMQKSCDSEFLKDSNMIKDNIYINFFNTTYDIVNPTTEAKMLYSEEHF